MRKFISLRYICRNESSFITIILNIWRKLIFLFQLLSKFGENVNLPMKAERQYLRKYFSRKSFKAFVLKLMRLRILRNSLEWLLPKNTRRFFQGQYQLLNVHSPVKSQQQKRGNKLRNLFKVSNKEIRTNLSS